MTVAARTVLADCELALAMLEEEERADRWRVLWIAGVTALRTVGDAFHRVDADGDPVIGRVVRAHHRRWVDEPGPDQDMFRDFIKSERDDLVHLYRFGPSDADGHVLVFDGGDSAATVEADLYRPLVDGPFAGEDARDVFVRAVEWWQTKLNLIDSETTKTLRTS